MINLKSIRGTNFRSFKEFNLEIRDGLWMVKGINNDDSLSDSNGAGKSSIFVEAPYWCLTGKTTVPMDSADDVVNLSVGKDCLVEMILESPEGMIKVTRTRKHKDHGNNLLLEINEQNVTAHRVADTQKRLDSIIKVSPDILRSTIVMASDISNKFTELSPAARVSLLESIRDYHVWERFRDISKLNLDDINKKISNLELSKSKFNGSIETIRDILVKYSNEYDEENNKSLSKDELENIKKDISYTEFDIESCKESISSLEPESNKLSNTISKLLVESNDSTKERCSLSKNKFDIESNNRSLEDKIKKLEESLNAGILGICPTCGSPYKLSELKINEYKELIKTASDSLSNNNAKLKEINLRLEELENTHNDTSNFDIFNKKKKLDKSISELKDELSEDNKKLSNLKLSYEKLESDINNHESRLSDILKSIKEYKSKLIELYDEIKKSDDEIKILQEELKVYKFYYDCLGPRGNLRPYLLNKDIDFINKSLKHYSDMMFSSVIISLSKPTVDDNKINVVIKTSSGLTKSIGMLSKGEMRRVDLCIQFAIYDLIKSTSMFDTNILILDEIFDGLDVSGLNRVVDLLLERSEFIQCMYIISHNPNISNLIHSRVTVEKSNDISKISYNTDNLTGDK